MADTYLDWWTSIDTDVRKSIIVNARRDTERLHALARMAYEHGQASALASRPAEVDERLAETYRDAIATVCEGWTLPADARKVLEKALWAAPSHTTNKEK